MSALVEFLLARIAEDEAVAREALEDGDGVPEPEPWRAVGWPASEHPGPVVLVDPRRFLREVEARRRIVALHRGFRDEHPGTTALHYLALVYADHPDYREEWKP